MAFNGNSFSALFTSQVGILHKIWRKYAAVGYGFSIYLCGIPGPMNHLTLEVMGTNLYCWAPIKNWFVENWQKRETNGKKKRRKVCNNNARLRPSKGLHFDADGK